MTTAELLETVRRVEVRTNRLVNAAAACFVPASWDPKPIEIERFGNCGEFAIIKSRANDPLLVLISAPQL